MKKETPISWLIKVVIAIIPGLVEFYLFKEVGKINEEWWQHIIIAVITLLCIYLLTKKETVSKRQIIFGFIGGVSYSLSFVIGTMFHERLYVIRNLGDGINILMLSIGYAIFASSLFTAILVYLPAIREFLWKKESKKERKSYYPIVVFLFYFAIIFLTFIPVFLTYYPVLLQHDGHAQLYDVVTNKYTTWHPLAHTLLMGVCYKWGVSIGSASVGISIYSLIQMTLMALVFARGLYLLYKNHAPRCLRLGALAFYTLFPVNAIFSISTTKDVLFAIFFMAFTIELINIMLNIKKATWVMFVSLAVAGGAMALYRNNGIYALYAALPIIVWCLKGVRIKIVLAVMGSVLIYTQVNQFLIESVDARENIMLSEKLSVPLMQLTKTVRDNKDSMSSETLEEIYRYISEDTMKKYTPVISDPIKSNVNNKLLEANTNNFLKLWAKTGMRYPLEYIDAATALTMGYWYIDDWYHSVVSGAYMFIEHKLIGCGEEIVKVNYCPIAGKVINYMFLDNNYQNIPVLATLCKPALYFWIIVGYALIVLYEKKWKLLAPVILSITYYATAFLGPVVLVRYMYCIMIVAPILISLLFIKGCNGEAIKNEN